MNIVREVGGGFRFFGLFFLLPASVANAKAAAFIAVITPALFAAG